MHIVTVATGDYAKGAAALVNSLAATGFAGRITVGHQGPLQMQTRPDAPVELLEIPATNKLTATNLKANIVARVGSGDICYVDADCIVTSPQLLKIVSEFLDIGPVFCAESMMPSCDARYRAWAKSLVAIGIHQAEPPHAICRPYFNAGFFALRLPRDAEYLERYQRLLGSALLDDGRFHGTPYFAMADQDCLNAAIISIARPMTSIGPPDVWFRALPVNPYLVVGIEPEPVLLHCTGAGKKPWRFDVPPLRRPDAYDKAFYHFAYRSTPWATIADDVPKRMKIWFADSAAGKMDLRLRRHRQRISEIVSAFG